jgi:DNA-binding CsgD family transcriptional regulator
MSLRPEPSSAVPHDGEDAGEANSGGRKGESETAERVLLAVSHTLTGWDSFEAASERLLRDLAGALGLPAAALWLPDGESLVARSTWSASARIRTELDRSVRSRRPKRGEGLAGSAWKYREPVHTAPSARVGGGAPQDGRRALQPLLAVPACAGEEVLGVVELYSASHHESSRRLLDVLSVAGQLLGTVFARRRGELKLSPLTARELQVLTLAADGLTGRGIAARLEISPATVKTHFEHIFRKLEVGDRTAAVAHAIRGGLIG